MAAPNYTLPQSNQPMVDPKTGIVTWTWYQFLRFFYSGAGGGTPLGTAATKAASNTTDANLASINLPVTVGHIATYADTLGTITDGGALGTAATKNTGTSGGTVPLLNGANTWSGTQTFGSGDLIAPDVTNGGFLQTFPSTAADTIVARNTTDTLTNKTISGASNTLSNISPASILSAPITNSLSGNVALNNTALYFDGPSVAQGVTGTWFASGTVSCIDNTAINSLFRARLWDGTTVIASTQEFQSVAGGEVTLSLSGFITSPAGNLRISVRETTAATGVISANATGDSTDSTITAFRIK